MTKFFCFLFELVHSDLYSELSNSYNPVSSRSLYIDIPLLYIPFTLYRYISYYMILNCFKRQPPGKNETISVGMDVWFLNQVDAVQQVFDANLFQVSTNTAMSLRLPEIVSEPKSRENCP